MEFKEEIPVTVYDNFNGNMENYGDYKKILIHEKLKNNWPML